MRFQCGVEFAGLTIASAEAPDDTAVVPSSAVGYAGTLTATGTTDVVRFTCRNRVVATHRRCWQKRQTIFDPLHYLALLERKPGALDHAAPLANWDLPGCFAALRRRLETVDPAAATGEVATPGVALIVPATDLPVRIVMK